MSSCRLRKCVPAANHLPKSTQILNHYFGITHDYYYFETCFPTEKIDIL